MTPPTRADLHPETRQFLKEWLEWAENGAPEHPVFDRSDGLCRSAAEYDDLNNTDTHSDLRKAFDGESCPFGDDEYWRCAIARTQHLDPNRLAWVRANI